MAHVGVLQALDDAQIPISFISGVSAGAIVAAAYASGTSPQQIASLSRTLRFNDFSRWKPCKLGFCCTNGMHRLLTRILQHSRFEEMRIPLTVAATDLQTGEPVVFQSSGDVDLAIRASCAFPGVFQPVLWNDRVLTDGAISMEVPAKLVRDMGAQRVISVGIPGGNASRAPGNLLDVVGRSLEIMHMRTEDSWRRHSDLVIAPDVSGWSWYDFRNSAALIEAGAAAARKAVPAIRVWMQLAPSPLPLSPAA